MSRLERTHVLPDGRGVRATYAGEPVGWVVHLVGHEERTVAARDIHDALADLLEPGDGGWPSWLIVAAADLAARDTPLGRRYPCPCCGLLTLHEAPTGTYEICEVGFSEEDDGVQFHDLDEEGGANSVSLTGPARASASTASASPASRRTSGRRCGGAALNRREPAGP
jgi:hypothetical protein